MLEPKREKIFNLRNFSQFGSLNVALQTGSLPLTSMRRIASHARGKLKLQLAADSPCYPALSENLSEIIPCYGYGAR